MQPRIGNSEPGPAVAERAAMARSLGLLYIAGATIGLVSLFLPRAAHTNVGALAVNTALAYAGGVTILLLFSRLPAWTFHVALLVGAGLITRAVYYSGQGVSYYGIWYLWAALFGFSFFRRSHATLHVAAVGVAYGWVLAVRHEPVALGRWVTTVASLLIAGMFIDALVRRVREQRAQAANDAENLAAVVAATQRNFQQHSTEATRTDLCETALAVAGATGCILWEPHTTGLALVPVATAGNDIAAQDVRLNDSRRGAARAYLTGKSRYSVCGDECGAELDSSGREGIRGALWQPVTRDQTTVGVLAVYWVSPIGAPERSVQVAIALLAAQTAVAIERVELLARLERVARTDELTGLLNRRAWHETLPAEMARATRDGRPLTIAMLDIDGLKRVNDTLGHQAGDMLLKQNAAAWSSVLRPMDVLARYGGDEFALALPACSLDDAHRLVERLVNATPEGQGFCMGIAVWDGSQDIHELMAEADAQLYAAKNGRTNLVAESADAVSLVPQASVGQRTRG
jgi:diguanylate cyclase (GGDEF)-like protein